MGRFAKILLPRALSEPLDYGVPPHMVLAPGSFVAVPLGKKREIGVVWELTDKTEVPEEKLRDVLESLPTPPLKPNFIQFIDWVAEYCMAPRGAVLSMAMSVSQVFEPVKPEIVVSLTGKPPSKMSAAREKVIALLEEHETLPKSDVAKLADVGSAVVNGLIQQGVLKETEETPAPISYPAYVPEKAYHPALSPEQKKAADVLRASVEEKKYRTTVLDGVTGSGKTEVYLEAVEEALAEGKQVLVLLPEIVLTTQLMARFEKRLGFEPTAWHSALTPRERRENWKAIHDGRAKLIVGARSALFLPYDDLALIIVDEEHETAYKQEDGVIYHGRDMAVARGFIEQIPVALVSATPSLETLSNVENGKFTRLHLPERHGVAELPEVELIDMRAAHLDAKHFISPTLKEAMVQTLSMGEQVLLYLNRRGYAPLTLCRKCGYRFKCPQCSAWLVMHKKPEKLQCHHCGYQEVLPESCPECKEKETLVPCGPGVERLTEEVKEIFPEARVLEMTSDSLGNPKDAEKTVTAILERQADIIIGTQMVVKGHHFPFLTLVGVVDADLGLEGGDLRAGEKSYQILHQVAGRAGREGLKGRALLQTYQPQNPLMEAIRTHDRDAFVEREKTQRREAGMPPFGRLAAMIISGKRENEVRKTAQELVSLAPQAEGIRVLGPAPAPLSLLRGQYRYRILVKTDKNIALQRYLTTWIKNKKIPSSQRLKVDIDPYSFL